MPLALPLPLRCCGQAMCLAERANYVCFSKDRGSAAMNIITSDFEA